MPRVAPTAKAYALVLAVALAASVTSLRNGFVYDDNSAIKGDARVHTLVHAPRLLVTPYWTKDVRDKVYRPLTTTAFAVLWAAGRGAPWIYHAADVAIHLGVVALVLALAGAVLGRGAVVAALWFAVHPVHVEVVANAVGIAELMAAAAYLGTVLCYRAEGAAARSDPGGARRALLAAAVLACAALALGAKEHALTLPAALLLVDAWDRRATGGSWAALVRRRVVLWLGVVALAAGYLAAREAIVGGIGAGSVAPGLEALGLAARIVVMIPAFLVWARLLVFPLHLSADYAPDAFAPVLTLTAAHVAGLLLLAGAFGAAWAARRRLPALTFGLVWFVITASVAANILVPTGVLLAERVLFLPSVGAAIVIGALWERLPATGAAWAGTALVLALLGARTLERIPVWRQQERFYQALLRDAPDSYHTHWARGARAFDQGDARTGEHEYFTAIRIHPEDAAVVQELGERYLAAGLFAPADRFLTAAFREDSIRSDAALEAVMARTRMGRADSAVALGEAALRRFPDVPTLLLATSDAYLALGRPLSALVLRRRITYLVPDSWQYQHIAAFGAAMAGRCDEARTRLERAVAMAPPGEAVPRRFLASLTPGPTCGQARP